MNNKQNREIKLCLCGPNEPCFEQGKCWGHLEGVMCEHLEECDEILQGLRSICGITKKMVRPYSTKREYDTLINMLDEIDKR